MTMRTCHACNRELDATAIQAGQCPHCGTIQRKIAQRTLDDSKLRDPGGKAKDIELIIESDESLELELTDTDRGGGTIEQSHFFDLDEYQKNKPPSGEQAAQQPAEPAAADKPKTPTVPDRNDMTMEFERSRPRIRRPPTGRRRRRLPIATT